MPLPPAGERNPYRRLQADAPLSRAASTFGTYPGSNSTHRCNGRRFATVELLQARDNNVIVILTPLNEHMLTAESRQRYQATLAVVESWLREQQIVHVAPAVLPSDEYADLSHALAPGYARLAKAIRAIESFQHWLAASDPDGT